MAALRPLMAHTKLAPSIASTVKPGLSVAAILIVFVAFWTVFAALSRYNLDIHGDMLENFAWGIGWQLGYYKHPPLYSWISAAWLSIFPRTNFFYHMLSMTSVAVAAFGMWRISTRFFTPSQQILLVAMVFFLPPLTFLSINYNATSSMAPFWAFTLLFYIRTLEKRRPLDAFMVGLIGGLALLAKYHSAVILLAIFVHALADPEARTLFRTRLPLYAIIGGLIPIAPHLYWLFETGFMTVRYAAEQGTGHWSDSLVGAAQFLPAILIYALPGFLLLVLHRYPGDGLPIVAREQVRALWATVEGRALLAAILLPTLITVLLGLVLDAQLSSLWSIPFFVFLPFLMVSFMPKSLAERQRIVVPAIIVVFCVAALLLAPTIRRLTLENGRSNSAVPIETIAETVQAKWRAQANRPLRIVASDANFLANGVAFYASDRPYAVQGLQWKITPWVRPGDLQHAGAALLCDAATVQCEKAAQRFLGRIDVSEAFEAPSPAGAGGPANRAYQLYMRMPAKPAPKPAETLPG